MRWERVTMAGDDGFTWVEYHLVDPVAELVLATCIKSGPSDYPWIWLDKSTGSTGRTSTLREAKNEAEDARGTWSQ